MFRKFILLTYAILLVVFGSSCMTKPDADPNITLQEITDKSKKASDPSGVFRRINTFYQKQKVVTENYGHGNTTVVETFFKVPNKIRSVNYVNGKLAYVRIFDGKLAFDIRPNQRPVPVVGKELEFLKLGVMMQSPKYEYKDVFKKVDIAVDGNRYKLTCYPKYDQIDPVVRYINADNFLTEKLDLVVELSGKKLDYRATIDKYSLCRGIMLAAKSTVKVGTATQTLTLEEFKINIGIKDEEFEPGINVKFVNSQL